MLTNIDAAILKSTPTHLGVESEIAEAEVLGESAVFIHHEVFEVVSNSIVCCRGATKSVAPVGNSVRHTGCSPWS